MGTTKKIATAMAAQVIPSCVGEEVKMSAVKKPNVHSMVAREKDVKLPRLSPGTAKRRNREDFQG